jgi:DNA-binding MarR family transcriptional regulator
MPPNIPQEELETVAALRVAIRRFLAASDDVTRAHGLTPRQYDLLALLHRPSPHGDLTASAIADELCLSRSATTELLTRAAEAGLVTRRSDEDDMRVKHLAPTRDGTKRFFVAVTELRGERNRILGLLRAVVALASTLFVP